MKNVSFVPESLFVPETVLNGNTISHFESGDIGNTPKSLENSVSNMCNPIKVKLELQIFLSYQMVQSRIWNAQLVNLPSLLDYA